MGPHFIALDKGCTYRRQVLDDKFKAGCSPRARGDGVSAHLMEIEPNGQFKTCSKYISPKYMLSSLIKLE